MELNRIALRVATIGDSEAILAWRNDAITRQMSHTTDLVRREQHEKWYTAALSAKNRLILMAESDKSAEIEHVAMVRFDLLEQKNDVEISINFNPNFRGMGLSSVVIERSFAELKKTWENVTNIFAEIKKTNPASIRTFERCGFTKVDEREEYFIYLRKLTQ